MRARANNFRKIVSALALILTTQTISAQYCDSITPTFNVDLSASPTMNWVSPSVQRDGNCCGTTNPDVCIEFIITLHPSAAAINLNIASGAVPPGALFYQVDCGPQTPVGTPICLDGAGPHHLTFCKPGNNQNTFEIVSYSDPQFGPDITLNSNCQDFIYAQFYDETTVNWTSVFPGVQGAYDSYLSCTSGCDTTYVTAPASGAPAYVDYLVCGQDINGCHVDPICDTIRVYFNDPVVLDVAPDNTHLCFGAPNQLVTSTVTGGVGPFSYSWSNGATSPNIFVGQGMYILDVIDPSGCIVATDSAIITQDALPIQANAGPDQVFCQQVVPTIQLAGTIQTATGGTWLGGTGTYAPNNTTLNATYTPTNAEVNAGGVTLTLVTTGNNGCPADTDHVYMSFVPFTTNISSNTSNISCNGGTDGYIHITTSGMYTPVQYALNGGAFTTNGNFDNLTAGNYNVLIQNSLGCDTTLYFTLTEPTPLTISLVSSSDVTCHSGNNGTAEVQAQGGTTGYAYLWSNGAQTSAVSSLVAGNYSCTVTDTNGCQAVMNVNISEPAAMDITFSTVIPNCHGADNGAISSFITGGTPGYTYQWSTGSTSSNLYNLVAGTYSLEVTDDEGCSVTDSVVVNQPNLMTGTITPDQIVCPNEVANLNVNISGGTGSYTYLWSPGDGNTSSIAVSPTQDQSYICDIVDNNGCNLQLITSVTVNQLNPDDIIASISDNVICEDEEVTIQGQYVGSDTTVTLAWLHTTADPLSPHNETPTGFTNYILSGTNYCNDQIFDTVHVTVNTLPKVDLDPIMAEVCPNESFTLYNLGDNDPSWTYHWDLGDGNIATAMNPTHSYSQHNVYTVQLTITDNNGCSSSDVDSSIVIVNPSAIASFSYTSGELNMLDPTVEFYNGSASATQFNWAFGDGNYSTQINPTHFYASEGTYIVELVANNQYGCADTTTRVIDIKPSFELYVPNAFTPDGDSFNDIFLPKGFGISEEDYQLLIFNRWGDIIFESQDLNVGWDGEHNGTVDSQTGVYTWVIYFRDTTDHIHKRHGHVSLLR